MEFQVTTHFADFPSPGFSHRLKQLPVIQSKFPNQTITDRMIEKNVLEIAVYYEQTSYKLVEQKESLSLIDLIATLGGTLGKSLVQSKQRLVTLF